MRFSQAGKSPCPLLLLILREEICILELYYEEELFLQSTRVSILARALALS